ncbi:type I restriction enzyme HsdR N-terminal domain-containing protein [Phenylobacterium sp.]|uniref:type I restriction enzyme HsdR N-terminal domain-containing protein n=1 Tax=Phenylobacterium sp. TaxID=1871053 RepID=UPI002731DD86|nr:type I restriction enzyme HsdR N-terminal domain-containing protein [Phenylobacterium sp.]MDP1875665.1 type I restriction enzyme HsdR N-terminal domain-containing protein [Phenylobacterium sp.]
MDLATRLAELQKRTLEHREVLLTEEAAKTALVMPFIQALGYDVFNPSEVVPEYTADVGTKKGEKVDYAICEGSKIKILIECKPANAPLNINHAGQLFRYFSVTDARLAILTNGVVFQFYSDVEAPNKMDDRPFFTFSMDALRPTDIRTLEKFSKASFDVEKIVQEAGALKLQSLLRKELETEFATPSDDFIKLMAGRVYEGRITPQIRDNIGRLLPGAISALVRDIVNERLSSALNASAVPDEAAAAAPTADHGEVHTTDDEVSGFHIVQAIASRLVNPKRIVMRDAKSYCAILLDDNNRKTIARLHFNAATAKYLGTFAGKDESRHLLTDLTEIYQRADQIEARIKELEADS